MDAIGPQVAPFSRTTMIGCTPLPSPGVTSPSELPTWRRATCDASFASGQATRPSTPGPAAKHGSNRLPPSDASSSELQRKASLREVTLEDAKHEPVDSNE